MKHNQIITAIVDNDAIVAAHFGEHDIKYKNIQGIRYQLTETSPKDVVYFGLKNTTTNRIDWLHSNFELAEAQRMRLETSVYVVVGLVFVE